MELLGATATHVGNVRETNQDRGHFGGLVAAVADGMGGHQGGETAASIAIAEFLDVPGPMGPGRLVELVEEANRAVFERAADPELRGMGTTLVAMVLRPAESKVTVVNVGDSRAYVLSNGNLGRLTNDHSLVEEMVRSKRLTPEEALHHPQRNILTRALGISSHVDVDQFVCPVGVGDRFLLCSDGLFNEVSEERIEQLLLAHQSPREAAEALLAAALEGAARDNITVVVADVVDDGHGGSLTPPTVDSLLVSGLHPTRVQPITAEVPVTPGPAARPNPGLDRGARTRTDGGRRPGSVLLEDSPGSSDLAGLEVAAATRTLAGEALANGGRSTGAVGTAARRGRRALGLVAAGVVLGAVLAGGVLGVRWYNGSIWFVEAADSGQVAIFNGRPGGLWLLQPKRLEHEGPQLDTLIPADQEQVATRPTFRSEAEAVAFLEGLTPEEEQVESATGVLGDVESEPTTPSGPSSTAPAAATTTTMVPSATTTSAGS